MSGTGAPGAARLRVAPGERRETVLRPRGLVDLRGREDAELTLGYPPDAVVVVSGLPGSGKSTLLRRWSATVPVVDPRDVHLACQAVMPEALPYAVYRPWARLEHARRLRAAVRRGGPLLVHDCGSRPWLRRWLARSAGSRGRELHLVLLDVGPAEALAGQRARGRWAPRRVFARHCRGLDRLLRAVPRPSATAAAPAPVPEGGRLAVPAAVAEVASLVLLDSASRGQASARFEPDPQPAPDGLPAG